MPTPASFPVIAMFRFRKRYSAPLPTVSEPSASVPDGSVSLVPVPAMMPPRASPSPDVRLISPETVSVEPSPMPSPISVVCKLRSTSPHVAVKVLTDIDALSPIINLLALLNVIPPATVIFAPSETAISRSFCDSDQSPPPRTMLPVISSVPPSVSVPAVVAVKSPPMYPFVAASVAAVPASVTAPAMFMVAPVISSLPESSVNPASVFSAVPTLPERISLPPSFTVSVPAPEMSPEIVAPSFPP